MNDSVFRAIKNNTVRDLYWLVFSDSPLKDEYDLKPFDQFPKSILKEWKQQCADYFNHLDDRPNDLILFTNRKKNKRLGFYAESLLSYFFQTFEPIELLLQNYQIIENKRTVGELDFIIRYKGKVIHLECAVKYYLLRHSTQINSAKYWVGPRLRDNLDLKLNKIIHQQLPLGRRKEVFEKINVEIDDSYLFLKGIFFIEDVSLGGGEIARSPNTYIRQSDLHNINTTPIQLLQKPFWLSSTVTEIRDPSDSLQLKEPLSEPKLFLFDDGISRFIVPNDWKE
ncbi:DUF1853 family protein [Brumimicrobium aurantiacum]|uniref:DUF1853 family protein n=1 Tax=Brumimicrobium aurantiacum TaxID=1737063 RepID=A0A3E1EW43_9FLAO|nr:DUF1853 family protein [Brumimicrobium aurantiacum]RFC53781.1 DUF1853 family protein [Brumimicrobium aurantiacum]